MSNTFLEHYGTKGMKWGIRKDRSGGKGSSSSKSVSQLSDKELQAKVNRLNLEKQYSSLTSSSSSKSLLDVGLQEVSKIVADASRQVATQLLKRKLLSVLDPPNN